MKKILPIVVIALIAIIMAHPINQGENSLIL